MSRPAEVIPIERELSPTSLSEMLQRIAFKLIAQVKPSDFDEANRYLEEHVQDCPLPELIKRLNDPIEEAQLLAFRAFEAETDSEANLLARQALDLDPNCIDALCVQAVCEPESNEERIGALDALIARIEDDWGPEFMEEHEGHCWRNINIRPYMRVREQLAILLHGEARLEEAADECREMLWLDPEDNLQMRDILMGALLEMGDHVAALNLAAEYEDDDTAVFEYGKLLAYFQADRLDAAQNALQRGIKANRHVFEYLVTKGAYALPDGSDPYQKGDEGEATVCLKTLGHAILATPGFYEWISLQ